MAEEVLSAFEGLNKTHIASSPVSSQGASCKTYPKNPSIQVLPALGPRVYIHDLLRPIWSLRVGLGVSRLGVSA